MLIIPWQRTLKIIYHYTSGVTNSNVYKSKPVANKKAGLGHSGVAGSGEDCGKMKSTYFV